MERVLPRGRAMGRCMLGCRWDVWIVVSDQTKLGDIDGFDEFDG